MYLDGKRVVLLAAVLLCGGISWWLWYMTEAYNQSTREMILEAETGVGSDDQARDIHDRFIRSMESSLQSLRQRDYRQSAETLYHAYPKFEVLLNSGWELELPGDQSLDETLQAQKQRFDREMEQAYPELVDQLVNGDIDPEIARKFFSQLPFAIAADWKSRFHADRETIQAQRVRNASDWILVKILASYGAESTFSDAIRRSIQEKWNPELPYKLVIGSTMSSTEERTAFRCLTFYVQFENARYQREGESNPYVGRDILESATLECIDRDSPSKGPPLNWQGLDPLTVSSPPPEKITFALEHENQPLDFDSVIQDQVNALAALLESRLDSHLPPLDWAKNE